MNDIINTQKLLDEMEANNPIAKEPYTNYDRICNMTVDEMVEFFTQEYDSDFGDVYCIPSICYDCKLYPTCDKFKENIRQWLLAEYESEG